MPDIHIQLDKTDFYPGQRVAGVVVLHLLRPLRLRGMRIRLVGMEQVRVQYGRQVKWTAAANIDQEVVLAGRERLPDMGAAIVDAWDTILQRSKHTRLLPGEYIYPFSIPIPSHAPASHKGKIARVDYRLQLTLDEPMKSSRVETMPLTVLPPGRDSTGYALALSVDGSELSSKGIHTKGSSVRFSIQLDRQDFWSGRCVTGTYTVENPDGEPLDGLVVSLKCREETYAEGGSGSEQWDVSRQRFNFEDKTAATQKGEISLQIPESATPSIAGRTFALTYSLDFRLIVPKSSDLLLEAQIGILPQPVKP
jgi:hypothetical protein